METSLAITRPPSAAVLDARAAVQAFAADATLQRALGIADVASTLTADDEVALGALALPLLQARLLTAEAARQRFGAEPVRLATELERLGSFGLRWDPSSGLSASQAETLRKMLLAIVTDPRLILLKLADRLHALRHAKPLGAAQQHQQALEAREIYAPLANRLGVWQVKWELEDLSFRYLEPDRYREIAAALNARRADRERYIHDVRTFLAAQLRNAGIGAEVTGRPKHIYSIWKKMQRKRLPFEQMFDIRALRVLVDSVADCYAALGVVHGLWPYIEGEYDDYIATPKGNNYRSLHTAVHGPDGLSLEVQIRTREMHDHAELGIAAHWKYKEGGARDAAYEAKIMWVRQLLEPDTEEKPEDDFIDRVRGELFEDRIYALTPKGEVVDLPKNATPLDFAYHVHTGLGHRCKGAKVNGRMVQLTYHLNNGEVVEIVAGKLPHPSRDWMNGRLGFLASAKNRAKVRQYFRALDEEKKTADREAAIVPVIPLRIRRTRVEAADLPKHVVVEGVGDLTPNLARCCNPAPPEPIVGYITLARGVSIHHAGCPSLLRMKALRPDRLLTVQWKKPTAYTR